jgi:hypothetical protein
MDQRTIDPAAIDAEVDRVLSLGVARCASAGA